ncbi:fucolectin-like [Rhinoraja longicauda]
MDSRLLLVFVCVWGVAKPHYPTGNLCATIRASQSSLMDFHGNAANAIDRNPDSNYEKGSCSSTAVEMSPWWSVDLFYHFRVYVVKITASRTGDGINDAEILIGDDKAVNGSGNQVCARNVRVPRGESVSVFCKPLGVHGRYITITIPGKTTSLSLCEVEALGAPEPH